MSTDCIDRTCFLARSGKPHNPRIGHLTETHSLPGTAHHLFTCFMSGKRDSDTREILESLRRNRDCDPTSRTFGCLKWYAESPTVYDTNASFFVCTPLAGIWLACRDQLTTTDLAALQAVFSDVLPWFMRMADTPSYHYPNKCISDAAMLLAAGHILEIDGVAVRAREFARRYFDYCHRRGIGWGEDHSPVYTRVILDMTLLMMALEQEGELYNEARAMTDSIMDWAAFHDGFDAVPSIRGYNFDARMESPYGIARLFGNDVDETPVDLLGLLKKITGYRFETREQTVPRERTWRTFDEHFSTSYIGENARLGTVSRYPLMPNTYMHDAWGLGWQSKPCSFIVHGHDYGILEWLTIDDEGVERQHESAGGVHDWASRHLFKRLSFHPDVTTVCHQRSGAAIVLREIHKLHSPTRSIIDRWRLVPGAANVTVDGDAVPEGATIGTSGWILFEYGTSAVGIWPLMCRGVDGPDDDVNPQRRLSGAVGQAPVRLVRGPRGLYLEMPLAEDNASVLTQHLLFSGWCVVLLDSASDISGYRVEEVFHEDGEVPRTYGETIRTVTLRTPGSVLRLQRDMLTGKTRRGVS